MSFSLAGMLVVVALLVPNLVMVAFPPRNAVERPPALRVLTALERAGQGSCIGLTIMAGDRLGVAMAGPWALPVGLCLVINLGLWLRYVAGGRDAHLLLAPLGPVPIPLALLPVLAFLLVAIAAGSRWLGVATLVLAAGHLGNTWRTFRSSSLARPPRRT